MGAANCCDAQDSKDGMIVPTSNAADQYRHAGMDEDDRAFDVAPPSKPTKQEPAGGPKHQSANVPALAMPRRTGDGQDQGHGGRAGALLISLDRTLASNIGLTLDALDGQTAFVNGILPGAVDSWNRKNPGSATMKAHDRIISVNSSSGDTDRLLREMRAATNWEVIVDRPVEVKVSVDCTKYPSLGLDLKYSQNGCTLLIADIGAGAIKDWNSTTNGPKIMPRDRIVEVNTVRGTARQLLDTATDVNELNLTILHYLTSEHYDQH